jgi:hypothetical protein
MPYDKAAALLRDLFSPSAIPLSTNAIGYASVEKVGPPACHQRRGHPPVLQHVLIRRRTRARRRTAQTLIRVFSTNISPTRLTCGLAAYRQTGIAGHTVTTAMQTALAEARAVGINRFVYWHLDDLRRNTAAGNVVRATRAAETGQV